MDNDVYDDMDADVYADVDHDVMMTSYLTRSTTRFLTRPGQRPDPVNDPDQIFDPTRSTTRTGQHPTRSTLTQQPVTRAATRFHTRRTFWWRVRARVRSFLGNLGICKLVSKFYTMWYIYFACLKLLQI